MAEPDYRSACLLLLDRLIHQTNADLYLNNTVGLESEACFELEFRARRWASGTVPPFGLHATTASSYPPRESELGIGQIARLSIWRGGPSQVLSPEKGIA